MPFPKLYSRGRALNDMGVSRIKAKEIPSMIGGGKEAPASLDMMGQNARLGSSNEYRS